ncbi:MAG: M50 family metallopeptidase [Leptospirales bacterium]
MNFESIKKSFRNDSENSELTSETGNVGKLELLGFIVFSILFVFLFGRSIFLSPLKYFATSIHESMHAIMAILTGGQVHEYVINADYSGHIMSSGGIGWLITSAGYIGAAFVAGFLIRFSTNMKASSIGVLVLGLLVAAMSLLFAKTWLSIGFILSLAVAAGLIFLVWKTKWDCHIAVFLGTFLSFQSMDDIYVYLFSYRMTGAYLQTDAYLLSTRLFGTELFTLPIALAFAAISIFIWWKFTSSLFKKSPATE